MKNSDVQVHVVTNPEAANLLADPAQLELLEPFFRGDVVLGELAKERGLKLNTLLYRVNKLVDLGLVEVVREEPRRGKPVKVYRAAARAFFVPFENTTSVSLGELLGGMTLEGGRLFHREAAKALQTLAPSWGLRIVLNEQKQLMALLTDSEGGRRGEFTDSFFGPAAPALFFGEVGSPSTSLLPKTCSGNFLSFSGGTPMSKRPGAALRLPPRPHACGGCLTRKGLATTTSESTAKH